jgi:hypothetical protein
MDQIARRTLAALFTASLFVSAAGCATTGSGRLSTSGAASAEHARMLQMRRSSIEHQRRVDIVAGNLLQTLPRNPRGAKTIYSGLHVADPRGRINVLLAEAVGLSHPRHPFVYSVDPLGPGADAGIQSGDEVVAFQKTRVASSKAFYKAVSRTDATRAITIEVLRRGERMTFELAPAYRPRDLTHFVVTDRDFVNAFADRKAVVLTAGMLEFLKGADELAVVLGHEIGHIVRGHLSGSYIGSGFNPSFSRDLEREADRYGLELAHQAGYNAAAGLDIWARFSGDMPGPFSERRFATHPTSLERLSLARKVLERLPPRPAGATPVDTPSMAQDPVD